MSWDSVSFLEVWTDKNVDPQQPDLLMAQRLAKRFTANAAANGFTLANFNFDDLSLVKYMTQAMTGPGESGDLLHFPKLWQKR